jgi:hypothetical protein
MKIELKLSRTEVAALKEHQKLAGADANALVTGLVSMFLRGQLERPKYMTATEIARAKSMKDEGYSLTEIGAELGRTKASVYRAINK